MKSLVIPKTGFFMLVFLSYTPLWAQEKTFIKEYTYSAGDTLNRLMFFKQN